MLNDHVIVRIGGGWDTLEHYIMTHLAKVGKDFYLQLTFLHVNSEAGTGDVL